MQVLVELAGYFYHSTTNLQSKHQLLFYLTLSQVNDQHGTNPKSPSSPKSGSTASIPSMLKSLHNEWDEVMLESYNLKKKLLDSRQQLSHTLYQYDAAVRVIARLTEERDRALQSVPSLTLCLSFSTFFVSDFTPNPLAPRH